MSLFPAKKAAARVVGSLSRRSGRGGGTSLPGKTLLRLAPDAIERLAAGLADGVVLVSATNGKTTTSALVAAALGPEHALCRNGAGANLLSGVASALLTAPSGSQLGLFEVDEFALPEIALRTRPRALLLSNLFRDQLDRYGELELVAERWRSMVAGLPPETLLVLAADDPVISALGDGRANVIRYGLDDPAVALTSLAESADSTTCVRCGHAYGYEAIYLGHLGDYRCPNCGHARPPLDVAVTSVELRGLDGSGFKVGGTRLELALPGIYNVYNAAGAFALATALGVEPAVAAERIGGARAAFGRFERVVVGDRDAVLLLVKNPAGANEALRTLAPNLDDAVLLLALNDRIADGRDVSWIWDVDFEIALPRAGHVVCSGTRAADIALRAKYAGVPDDRIEIVPGRAEALDRALDRAGSGGTAYVLPTYTAMLELQRVAAERGLVRPYWGGDRPVITIVPVYPTLLSIYADRGNVRVLEQRCAWRGIDYRVEPLSLGDDLDPAAADIILLGGGQDRDQVLVATELIRQTPRIGEAIADGACLLAVCGGYQLLGHRYRGHQGDDIPGTGLVDLETVAGDTRLIGNVLVDCGGGRTMVGFENHAGRTWLGGGVQPLGRVIAGAGNNGEDRTEGCRAERIVGTYVHGPLLPKNPWIADELIGHALARRGGSALLPLDDALEVRTAEGAAAIARAERR